MDMVAGAAGMYVPGRPACRSIAAAARTASRQRTRTARPSLAPPHDLGTRRRPCHDAGCDPPPCKTGEVGGERAEAHAPLPQHRAVVPC